MSAELFKKYHPFEMLYLEKTDNSAVLLHCSYTLNLIIKNDQVCILSKENINPNEMYGIDC